MCPGVKASSSLWVMAPPPTPHPESSVQTPSLAKDRTRGFPVLPPAPCLVLCESTISSITIIIASLQRNDRAEAWFETVNQGWAAISQASHSFRFQNTFKPGSLLRASTQDADLRSRIWLFSKVATWNFESKGMVGRWKGGGLADVWGAKRDLS